MADANRLGLLAKGAFERVLSRSEGHQPLDIGGLIAFVQLLRRRADVLTGGQTVSELVARDLVANSIAGTDGFAGSQANEERVWKAATDIHQVLIRAGTGWRLTNKDDLHWDAMACGEVVVAVSTNEAARRLLAINHLLIFPEAVHILRVFSPPGAGKAAADGLSDRFFFARKLNDVTTGYCLDELLKLGLLKKANDDRVCVDPSPLPSVLAFNLIDAALQASDYQLDRQIRTQVVLDQLRMWTGPADRLVRANVLHHQLGSPEPLARFELAGAQLRITESSFEWLVANGLVDPLSVARVLKARGSAEAVDRIGQPVLAKIKKTLPPLNMPDYLAVFSQ